MKLRTTIVLVALVLAGLGRVRAADLTGKWTAEFDSQIGIQKYAYEFRVEGDKITGKATFEHSMAQGTVELKEIKLDKDNVSFVEALNMNGMDLVITYAGKIAGDEIKLTRTVGDFGTEELVAKRVKPEVKPDPKPETKPETKPTAVK